MTEHPTPGRTWRGVLGADDGLGLLKAGASWDSGTREMFLTGPVRMNMWCVHASVIRTLPILSQEEWDSYRLRPPMTPNGATRHAGARI